MKRQRDDEAPSEVKRQTGSLHGKVILITGGTQGQGLATARMCVSRGASAIVICGRNEENGKKAAAELAALGSAESLYVQCDVSKPEAIADVVSKADDKFGRIDGLVNCAGDSTRGDLDSTTADEWDRQMSINLRSHFLFTQHVSKVMRRTRTRGSIVNIASVQAYGGLTFCLPYAVAKAGLVALTKNNASELAPHGIRVNAVNMGWCVTDNEIKLQTAQGGEDWIEKADQSVPLGRISRPEDIAHAILFLLSDEAYTTGSVMAMHPEYIHGILGGAIGKSADL